MVDKVLHAQMPFTTGKQTINDRLTAAYHSLAGSQLGKTVCKATTEEEMGPKKKHLDYLLHCTNEPNVSIPQLANMLVERTTSSNWCTVYKAMISIHNLMCYGNERFSQYLASSNANFNLGNFLDKTSVQGYDMSTHVRRYAKYIGEKIYTYRMMAFDFCKVKRGREDGLLRTMPTDRLLKTLPLLQEQIDVLLDFQVSSAELNNGVINSCFILLFRDLIRLFACYNDGMINLLEKYFDMNKKQCKDALELYKNFLTRMDKVAEFLKVAESVGIDKCEIPDLTRAPSSLVEALEQHLVSLEGGVVTANGSSQKPGSRVTSPTSWTNTQNAIQQLSSSGGFASTVVDPNDLDDQMKAKILQEEEQRLQMLKEQRLREIELSGRSRIDTQKAASTPKTNPFLQTPVNDASAKSSSIDDLLSLDFSTPVVAPSATAGPTATASTNPFASMTSSLPNAVNPYASSVAFGGGQQNATASFGGSPGNNYTNGHSTFASDDNFAKAFPSQSTDSHVGYRPTDYYYSAEVSRQQAQNPIRAPSRPSLTPSDQDIEIPPAGGFNPFLTDDSTPKIPDAVESQESIEEDHAVVAANPFAVFQKNAQAFVSAESSSLYVIGDPSAVETPSPQPPYGGLSPQPPFEESESNQFFPVAAAVLHQPSTAPTSHHGTPSKMSSTLDTQSTNRPASQPSGAAPGQQIFQQQSTQYQSYGVAFDPQFTSNVPDPNVYKNLPQQTGFNSWMPDSTSQQVVQQQPSYAYQQQTSALNQFGAPQKPGQQKPSTMPAGGKLIKGDLDSTLANLAQNLNISKGQDALKNKPVQWNPQQKPAAFQAGFTPQQGPPSGYGYQQQPMAPGWGAPQPMMMGQNAQYGMQMPYGQQQPMYNMQPAGVQPSGYIGVTNHPQQNPQVRPNPMNASDPFGTL